VYFNVNKTTTGTQVLPSIKKHLTKVESSIHVNYTAVLYETNRTKACNVVDMDATEIIGNYIKKS